MVSFLGVPCCWNAGQTRVLELLAMSRSGSDAKRRCSQRPFHVLDDDSRRLFSGGRDHWVGAPPLHVPGDDGVVAVSTCIH